MGKCQARSFPATYQVGGQFPCIRVGEGNHVVSYCTASVYRPDQPRGCDSHSSRKATVRCSSRVASVQGTLRSWNIFAMRTTGAAQVGRGRKRVRVGKSCELLPSAICIVISCRPPRVKRLGVALSCWTSLTPTSQPAPPPPRPPSPRRASPLARQHPRSPAARVRDRPRPPS